MPIQTPPTLHRFAEGAVKSLHNLPQPNSRKRARADEDAASQAWPAINSIISRVPKERKKECTDYFSCKDQALAQSVSRGNIEVAPMLSSPPSVPMPLSSLSGNPKPTTASLALPPRMKMSMQTSPTPESTMQMSDVAFPTYRYDFPGTRLATDRFIESQHAADTLPSICFFSFSRLRLTAARASAYSPTDAPAPTVSCKELDAIWTMDEDTLQERTLTACLRAVESAGQLPWLQPYY